MILSCQNSPVTRGQREPNGVLLFRNSKAASMEWADGFPFLLAFACSDREGGIGRPSEGGSTSVPKRNSVTELRVKRAAKSYFHQHQVQLIAANVKTHTWKSKE